MKAIIDLRSDTVTKPTKAMLECISGAKVGDDVYKEDPTVNELERKISQMANKEDALFVPTGTMSNLLALLSHCGRGDEYICGQDAHMYKYEAGGGAVVGSIQPQPIEFELDGSLDLEKVKEKIKPSDSHFAKSRLLCLENTHHGQTLSLKYLKKAYKFAQKHHLLLHIDGARVFNAAVYLDVPLSEITKYCDTISICLSKGLGAPAGSLLVGSTKFIAQARRYRKMVGGGMRQAGIIASCGIYALKNNIKGLANDHKNAKKLADTISELKHIKLLSNHTNMLFIQCKKEKELVEYLKTNGILISGYGKLRMVFHQDISSKQTQKVIEVFRAFDVL